MLPASKRIAICEVLVVGILAMVFLIDRITGGGGPDSSITAFVLIIVFFGAAGTFLTTLFSIPSAAIALFREPAQRTPLQIVIVLGGVALVAVLGGWLGMLFFQS